MTHTFELYDLPDEVFLANGIEQVSRCDAVLLVGDWRSSSGTANEIAQADGLGIPVYSNIDKLCFAFPTEVTP